ncbi:MAG: cysteine--tRNA ligase [Clostridia bacterium]|nr:cysteine--tRNA ligase [Clostridia bacterium]
MKIYNTLTGSKQEFNPIEQGKVKMYACGITVSGEAHIGHAYQALIYDIIRKYFEKKGYQVTYARNYTDVDDKIIAKSNETGIPADKYAKDMIKIIDKEMKRLDVDEPSIWIKATECIGDIISFVKKLIDKGHAYATERGDVYFAVDSYPAYGMLSHRNLEDAKNGVRIENEDNKRNPLDFALWKSAKEGEPFWESPWGKGRPGWHIECSTMNYKTFGEQIDIHGGGRDLIFPHHENEIAQTEALTGKQFAKYWIHNGLIKVNGQKMSKSLGNSLLLKDLLDKYSPEVIKFALLETNYRGDINITDNLFSDAEKHLTDFYKIIKLVSDNGIEIAGEYSEIDEKFNNAMDDDFNTALALSLLYGFFKQIKVYALEKNEIAGKMVSQIIKTYSLLGIFRSSADDFLNGDEKQDDIPLEIKTLAKQMQDARSIKDYATADSKRNEINEKGYNVQITKDGIVITKK